MEKQKNLLQVENRKLDNHIKNVLDATFALPPKVADAREESFAKVRALAAQEADSEQQNDRDFSGETRDRRCGKNRKKILFRGLAGAGVAAAAFSCIYMVNPSVTAQMPLVSHVFEQIGESLDFAGDFVLD